MVRQRANPLRLIWLALAATVLTGCLVPPMSTMQDARSVEAGEVRLTPYAGTIRESEGPNPEEISKHYGGLIGFGLGGNAELQIRYDRFQFEDGGYNFTAIGPKFANAGGSFAFVLPAGIYWDEELAIESFQLHPGFIFSIRPSDIVELNLGTKVIFPFDENYTRWGVLSLGLGLSSDLMKWAIMPEVAMAWDLGDSGDRLVSIGVAVALFK